MEHATSITTRFDSTKNSSVTCDNPMMDRNTNEKWFFPHYLTLVKRCRLPTRSPTFGYLEHIFHEFPSQHCRVGRQLMVTSTVQLRRTHSTCTYEHIWLTFRGLIDWNTYWQLVGSIQCGFTGFLQRVTQCRRIQNVLEATWNLSTVNIDIYP